MDAKKINIPVIEKWVVLKMQEILGFDDDVIVGMVMNTLQDSGKPIVRNEMHLNLTGFLDKNTSVFMKELWELLISAQEEPTGIPRKFLDAKAKELEAKKQRQVDTKPPQRRESRREDTETIKKNTTTDEKPAPRRRFRSKSRSQDRGRKDKSRKRSRSSGTWS